MSEQNIHNEVNALVNERLSLQLATVSTKGAPCASYAPYVRLDGPELCVYLSLLAQHTKNIENNPMVSVMIIEDESSSSNLFARERVVLDCVAKKLERNSPEWHKWLAPYKERFGAIVGTLVQLADFHLYLLEPQGGTYVKGFGQAYRLSGKNLSTAEHITNPAKDIEFNNK